MARESGFSGGLLYGNWGLGNQLEPCLGTPCVVVCRRRSCAVRLVGLCVLRFPWVVVFLSVSLVSFVASRSPWLALRLSWLYVL